MSLINKVCLWRKKLNFFFVQFPFFRYCRPYPLHYIHIRPRIGPLKGIYPPIQGDLFLLHHNSSEQSSWVQFDYRRLGRCFNSPLVMVLMLTVGSIINGYFSCSRKKTRQNSSFFTNCEIAHTKPMGHQVCFHLREPSSGEVFQQRVGYGTHVNSWIFHDGVFTLAWIRTQVPLTLCVWFLWRKFTEKSSLDFHAARKIPADVNSL